MSGMKGGSPAVDQNVEGVGKVNPNANCVSRSASAPASLAFCELMPPMTAYSQQRADAKGNEAASVPFTETNLNVELAACGTWSAWNNFKSSRFANCSRYPVIPIWLPFVADGVKPTAL